MQKKPQNLGRGLGALLGQSPLPDESPSHYESQATPTSQSEDSWVGATPLERELLERTQVGTLSQDTSQVVMLKIEDIKANPDQPRKVFSQTALDELAQSIRNFGILQPLIVFKDQNGLKYLLVAGERRLRAAQLLGLPHVPCLVRSRSEHSELELALIENIQRENLNPIEEAMAYQKLIAEHAFTHEQLAEKMGKDRATVTNSLRLLTLPAQIQDDVQEGRLSVGHAKVLCSLDDKKIQLRARDAVIAKKLSVRQCEILVQSLRQGGASKRIHSEGFLSQDVRFLCDQLKGHLGTKVKIAGTESRGKIEISYFSKNDLDRLAELVLGNPLSGIQGAFSSHHEAMGHDAG